jgi:uroporphyrinogen-III synthase
MRAQAGGLQVLLARSKEGNRELARKLNGIGLRAMTLSTLSFQEPVDWTTVDLQLRKLDSFDWLVFTSPTGVRFFARRLKELRLGFPPGARPRVAAVGEKTAERLLEEGFRVDFIPTRYLTSALASQMPSRSGRRVLLLRADIANKELVTTLRRRGFNVTDIAVYHTRVFRGPSRGADRFKDADVVVFASPSEVQGFLAKVPASVATSVQATAIAACIGPVTASAARQAGFLKIVTPSKQTIDALLQEIRRLAKDA